MKIVLLTSESYRHKYIAHKLFQHFDLKLIITEKKSVMIENVSDLEKNDKFFINNHFEQRKKSELNYFFDYQLFPDTPFLSVNHGEINSEFVFEKIKKIEPDFIVLFGTSIIKNPILNYFDGKIINLHLGLSPYYKGSATNLFPILFKDFEGIGATIHIATEKVDDGPILHQLRPEININDSLHDIGNKVIRKAGIELPKIITFFGNGDLKGIKVSGQGVLCKNKDLTVEKLKIIYSNINQETLRVFIENYSNKCAKKPIVEVSGSIKNND